MKSDREPGEVEGHRNGARCLINSRELQKLLATRNFGNVS